MRWERVSLKWKITLFIVLVGALVMIYETTKPYPRVVLQELGELMTQVQENSTYPFELEPEEAETFWPYYAGVRDPFVFEYQNNTLGFTLPPSRYGYFDSFMGHIVGAEVTAHLKALTESEALTLIHQLSAEFDNLGWERTSKDNPSDANILAKFHKPPITGGISMWVAYWQNDDTELYIEMKRVELSTFQGKAKPRYGYLVTVFLENKKVYERYLQLWVNRPK